MELKLKIEHCAKGFAAICIIAFSIKAIVNFSVAGAIGNISSGYFRLDGLATALVFFGIADFIIGIGAAVCFYYPILGIATICREPLASTTPTQNLIKTKTESGFKDFLGKTNTSEAEIVSKSPSEHIDKAHSVSEELSDTIICPSCGTKSKPNNSFCFHCGTKLS